MYRSRLLEPVSVWKTFPRLKLALEYAINCFQDVAVFSYESDSFSNPGGRRFLVTTYYEFGKRYILMKPPRHFYEVITEDTVCHLYFDIEYNVKLNPSLKPLKVLEIFKQYVACQLMHVFSVYAGPEHILDLDSTTEDKFSRHLIYHLNNSAFRNNICVGEFVKYICERLRAVKAAISNGLAEATTINGYRDLIHCGSTNYGDINCSCPTVEELLSLFVKTSKGTCLICDEAVYTRNRNFRLLLSTKRGKKAKLMISKENTFKSNHAIDPKRKKWSKLYNALMDSLVCSVNFELTSVILDSPFRMKQSVIVPSAPSVPPIIPPSASSNPHGSCHLTSSSGHDTGVEGTCSPYPAVDQFITSQLVRDGLTGRIRQWTYFSQGKLILYEIVGYRWCENIGRHHKSNNIMIIVDLKEASFYQKCHDPDCKRINFRSDKYPLPQQLLACLGTSEEGREPIDPGNISETRRMLVSEFGENDRITDSNQEQLTTAEGQLGQNTNHLQQQDKDAYCDLLLDDLSFEEIFDTHSDDGCDEQSRAVNSQGPSCLNTSLSEANRTNTDDSSPLAGRTFSHASVTSSTPIKQEVTVMPYGGKLRSFNSRTTCKRRLVEVKATGDHEMNNVHLSEQEMNSFLEDSDCEDTKVKVKKMDTEIDDPLNLSQEEMNSFLEDSNGEADAQIDMAENDPLSLSQEEMNSFLEDLDSNCEDKVKEERIDMAKNDDPLKLSQEEMNSFLEDSDCEDAIVKEEQIDSTENDPLKLSQEEMNSFLEDSDCEDAIVKEEQIDSTENDPLNFSQEEMNSFLESSND